MNTTPTRFTEIGMIVLASLLILVGGALIFFGKITFIEFSPFLIAVLGLFGINVAWKAPSPDQAQQLNTLQTQANTHSDQLNAQQQQIASVQNVVAHVANVVTPLQEVSHTHPPVQEQPEQQAPPVQQFASRHFGDTNTMAAMQTMPYPSIQAQQ